MDSLVKKRVDAEIHQIMQIFGPYWSQLKAGKYYAWSWSKALSHTFEREEEGTVFGDIEARLTRNLCESILYFYGEICGILENVPRFLKNAFHIPEERHLGLASLQKIFGLEIPVTFWVTLHMLLHKLLQSLIHLRSKLTSMCSFQAKVFSLFQSCDPILLFYCIC